ncbi:LCP family protein [Thermoactinospora rubra]|uniref:LCP family protein n=1 Tax=Thermoactinospora rubra TaxID=1088767 RepID=UPI0011803426|nr:LCP family protein [Thermoactinospora rubra]
MTEGEAASERPRTRRRKLLIVTALVLLVPLAALTILAFERQYTYNSNIKRIGQVFPDEPERPARVAGSAQNWLFVGSDRRPEELGHQRADTIMIVHLPPDRRRVYLISIPRDAYVPIPGHGKDKINAAYAFGGPKLLIKTVEQLTKVRIDHFAALDFRGFVDITKAIGGVELHLMQTVHDPISKITWKQGKVVLEGESALNFVRQRYNLAGGDFDRIKRQQAFLRALGEKVVSKGTLTDPLALNELLEAVTKSISVDSGVTLGTLRDLALELRHVRAKDLISTVVPMKGVGTVKGASVVKLDAAESAKLYEALRTNKIGEYLPEDSLTSTYVW